MPFETIDDFRSTFFEIDGGPATRALILGPATMPANEQFAVTIAVIFRRSSQSVAIYGDTDVEASAPSILCMAADLEGVDPGMTLRFLGLLPGEDGYGQTYKITQRIVAEGVQASRIYLKES
jgi:hypothetical protein